MEGVAAARSTPGGWPALALRWLTVTFAVAALTAALVYLHRAPLPAETLTIQAVRFLDTDARAIPAAADHGWSARALPDDWADRAPRRSIGWYRVALDLNVAPDRLWGVYLPAVNQNVAVYLNGELLGDGGRFEAPVARNWNRPLYFSIPNGLLRPGRNQLSLRVHTEPARAGLLGLIHLGPASALRPAYERHFFLRYTAAQLIVITLAVVSVMMLVLWYWRRRDSLYAWYALAAALWAVHNLNLVVVDIPMPARAWDWAMWVSLLWLPIVSNVFIRRFLGLARARIETLFCVAGATVSILLALPLADALHVPTVRVAGAMALGIGVYPVWLLLAHFWRSARLDVLLLMAGGSFMVVLGAHDMLVLARVLERSDGYYMHFSAPLVLVVFGAILLRRFVEALGEAETLNRDLEARVAAKTQELSQSYQQMRQIERERVLAEERARLMSDMHDGIGGQLVSTLALLEGGTSDAPRLREALQGTLDDLRLMIDSMEEVDGDLLTILGMLRTRLEPRLAGAGIALHWRVADVPAIADLGPQRVLQVMRVVQEAFTNVIKHARAASITVTTDSAPAADGVPGAVIMISDDGIGIAADAASAGRGLRNMQRRAQKLGGRVEVTRAPRGTNVRLWVPAQEFTATATDV